MIALPRSHSSRQVSFAFTVFARFVVISGWFIKYLVVYGTTSPM